MYILGYNPCDFTSILTMVMFKLSMSIGKQKSLMIGDMQVPKGKLLFGYKCDMHLEHEYLNENVIHTRSYADLSSLDETTFSELMENVIFADIDIKQCAYRDWETDRKSTRLNSSHSAKSRMPSSA